MERHVVDLAGVQSDVHDVMVAGAPNVLGRLAPSVAHAVLPLQHSRYHPRLLLALRRELARFRPDVVHAHNTKAAALVDIACRLLPKMARVATVHGTKNSTRVFSRFDCAIAVSRTAGSQLVFPHHVIWNGVNAMPIAPGADASTLPFLNQARPIAIAVGRLADVKGFDVLLEALRQVDLQLWIVGDGPERSKLEAQARRIGVVDRVWFAGFREDAGWLMSLADFMIISSRREGFPLVLVEMLHRRRPVISTRVGGSEEILPAEWLCAPAHPDSLAQLIARALGKLPSLSSDFEPVFQIAVRELTVAASSRKIMDVYRESLIRAGLNAR